MSEHHAMHFLHDLDNYMYYVCDKCPRIVKVSTEGKEIETVDPGDTSVSHSMGTANIFGGQFDKDWLGPFRDRYPDRL